MNERERFEELLGEYAEGTLSPADAVAWEALLVAHADWRTEAEQERALVAMMRGAGKLKAPANLKAEVLNEITKQTPVVVIAKRNTRVVWQVAAVAAILIAGIFVYTNNDEPVIGMKKRSAAAEGPIRIANTERLLSDAVATAPSDNFARKAAGLSTENEVKLKRDDGTIQESVIAGAMVREEDADKGVGKFAPPEGAAGKLPEIAFGMSSPALKDGEQESIGGVAPAKEETALHDLRSDVSSRAKGLELAKSATAEDATRDPAVASPEPPGAPTPVTSTLNFEGGRSPSFGNAVPPEKTSGEKPKDYFYADQLGQQAARQSGEPALTLPTRDQVRSAVIAKTGKVLLDTPWYETAVDYKDENGVIPTPATAANARYIVAQMPSAEDAKSIPGAPLLDAPAQQPTNAPADEEARKQQPRDVRVIIPYAATRRDEMVLQQQEAAQKKNKLESADKAYGLDAVSSSESAIVPPAEEAKNRAVAPKALSATTSAAASMGTRTRAEKERPAATETFFKTYDDFDEWMRVNSAQFLFYTSDRSVAFSAESSEKTPVPIREQKLEKDFTGYLVYHFKTPKLGDAMLGKLPILTGEGVRNVGLTGAELVAQPDGVRLVVPYRMENGTP